MDRQEAQKAYALAVSAEREQYLYQHALSKAKAILRGMTPEEKEKYLQGQAFANALFRLKRRDKAYQALQRGELLLHRGLVLLGMETEEGNNDEDEDHHAAAGDGGQCLRNLRCHKLYYFLVKQIFRYKRSGRSHW